MIPQDTLIEVTYLIATALFILSLKWLSSPATARRGVWAGEIGMFLAIVGTLLHHGLTYRWVAIGLVLGTIIGVPLGKVAMTAVPQRTALSHAFGALCVTLVGTAEFYLRAPDVSKFMMSVLSLEVILGALTFTGSLMAAGKLQEVLPQRPITYKGQNIVNLGMLAVAIVIAVMLVRDPSKMFLFPLMIFIPLIFGVMMIIPIGGADMPTVISLLNSYAGLSAAAMGFVLGKQTAHHRWRLRRRIGLHPLRQHVQSDESFVHQRFVRRVRPRATNSRRKSRSPARAQRFAGRSRRNFRPQPAAAQRLVLLIAAAATEQQDGRGSRRRKPGRRCRSPAWPPGAR